MDNDRIKNILEQQLELLLSKSKEQGIDPVYYTHEIVNVINILRQYQ